MVILEDVVYGAAVSNNYSIRFDKNWMDKNIRSHIRLKENSKQYLKLNHSRNVFLFVYFDFNLSWQLNHFPHC